eukprot:171125_1
MANTWLRYLLRVLVVSISINPHHSLIHPKSDIQIKNLHPTNASMKYNIKDYQLNTPWESTDFCSSFYVSPLFTNHMILQRGSPGSSIFGWGQPGGVVQLEFSGKHYTTTISAKTHSLDACSWHIQLPPMPASDVIQYFNLSVSCNNCGNSSLQYTFRNIQFGDIWVCTGQSNMALPVNHTLSWFSPNVTNTCPDYNIRGLNIPQTLSDTPVDSRIFYGQTSVYWYDALYDNLTLNEMSAACYYFARNLYSMYNINGETKVPLGIVDATWGGSVIESWTGDITQNACDWRYCENYDGSAGHGIYSPGGAPCNHDTSTPNQTPGGLLNGMVYPLTNVSIYGALYYQGENNGFNPGNTLKNQGYSCMIPRMVEEWRDLWQEEIAFGIISLHGWCSEEAASCWNDKNYSDIYSDTIYPPTPFCLPWIRWAQTAELGRVPNYLFGDNTFVVMAYDLMDQGLGIAPPPPQFFMGALHPRNKMHLGERIARAALAVAYGDTKIAYSGPIVRDCYVDYDRELLMVIVDNRTEILRDEKVVIQYDFGFEVQSNVLWGGWSNVTTNGIVDNSVIVLDISSVLALDDTYNVSISAIRFGWKDNVGCWQPYWDYAWTPREDQNFNCSEGNYTIYSEPSHLPMIPFIYEINDEGDCLIQYNATSQSAERPAENHFDYLFGNSH